MTKRIAVVGAGPAGLTFALTLFAKHRGSEPVHITIFEQEADHDLQPRANPDRSYTIDITGHGRKAISSIGQNLLARFDKELIPFRGIRAYLLDRTLPYTEGGWTGSRGDICSALLHELRDWQGESPGEVTVDFCWSTKVTALNVNAGTLVVEGSSEPSEFDLIVAADGAGSFIRKTLEDKRLLKTEKFSINNYSRILHLDQNEPAKQLDPALLHMFSLRPWAVGGAILDSQEAHASADVIADRIDKAFYVQMGYGSDDPLGDANRVESLLTGIGFRLGNKRTSLRDFVSDEEIEAYSARNVYHTGRTVLSSTLVAGKCALIGDACTAFPPVGQGVNAALEAANLLGEEVIKGLSQGEPGLAQAQQRYNDTWLPEAHACARIANSVRYDSRINLAANLVLAALSELTRTEMVAAQLAKDAAFSYAQALSTSRRRSGLALLALAVLSAGLFLLLL